MILVQSFRLHTVDLHARGADCLMEAVPPPQRLLESLIVRSSRNLPAYAGRHKCLGEKTSNRSHIDAFTQTAFIGLRVLAEELFVIRQVHRRLLPCRSIVEPQALFRRARLDPMICTACKSKSLMIWTTLAPKVWFDTPFWHSRLQCKSYQR